MGENRVLGNTDILNVLTDEVPSLRATSGASLP